MESRTQTQAFFDGVVNHSLSVDQHRGGFQLTRHDMQDCAPILDHNRKIMAQGCSRTTSFGKVELCIPELELYNIKARFPDMASPDRDIKLKAWKKYLRMAESKPWRVSVPKYV